LPDQWKEPIVLPVHKKGDRTDCSNYRGIALLTNSYKIVSNIFSQGVHIQMKLIGIITVGFDVTDQLLIRFFALSDTGEIMGVQVQ
jgi:hypothetical protein